MNAKSIFLLVLIMIIPSMAMGVSIAPSGLSLTATDTSITATWTANALTTGYSTDGYYVYYGLSSSQLDSRKTVTGRLTSTTTITGLTASTTYYVAITGYDATGESEKSEVVSIQTSSQATTITTPTGLNVASVSDITETGVSLIWSSYSDANATQLILDYGTSSGVYSITIDGIKTSVSAYTVSDLSASTRYYFTILAADDSDNQSENSNELIVDTLPDSNPPNTPSGISAEISGTNEVQVNFSGNNDGMADLKGYRLYYKTQDEQDYTSVDIGNTDQYTFSDLTKGNTYDFKVSAFDESGNESGLTGGASVLVEDFNTFLIGTDDLEGGCFISNVYGKVSHFWGLGFFMILGICCLFGFLGSRFFKIFISLCLVFTCVQISQASEYKNKVGLKAGYFRHEEKLARDTYDRHYAVPVYLYYERELFWDFFSVETQVGFIRQRGNAITDSGKKTDVEVFLYYAPVSFTAQFTYDITPLISIYCGPGLDYWYFLEKTDFDKINAKDYDYGISGYHGKIGVTLLTADEDYYQRAGLQLEAIYSKIDRFGKNQLDLGGWSFLAGYFYKF